MRKFRKRAQSKETNRRRLTTIFVVILALILCLSLFFRYQIWRSYHTLSIAEYSLSYETIEQPVSIVFLSDLHENEIDEGNKSLIKAVYDLHPDLILVGGDMINETTEDFSSLENLLLRLQQTAPVICALGNKEIDNPLWTKEEKHLKTSGIPVLDKEYLDIQIGEMALRIGGLYDYTFALNGENTVMESQMDPKTYSFLKDFENTPSFKLMISHRPDSFYFSHDPDYWDVNLVLSGHLHGGQAILPLLGGIWAPDHGWFPGYCQGLTEVGSTALITSAGLGSGPEKLRRFNNPPQFVHLELKPEE